MEKELRLNPDEVVVLRSAGVGYGKSGFGRSHELVLTDQAIILIRKGAFGRTKDVLRFPLKDIRVVGGQVQAMMGKKDFMTPSLDVYFQAGMESFQFAWENDVKDWINNIRALVTGIPLPQRGEVDEVMENLTKVVTFMDGVDQKVSGSIDKVMASLGIKSHEPATAECPACGASLSGIRREVVKCPYCGTNVKL